MTLCEGVDREMGERVDKILRAGTTGIFAVMAEDRVSKYQSCLRRGVPIGRQRKSVGQEPQLYRAACNSPSKEISVMRCSTRSRASSTTSGSRSFALPAGHKPISAKWVCSWKANHLGEVTQEEILLGAWGFMQREGLDYLDAFSPTPVPSSIRMIAPTVLQRDWTVSRWDIE